MYTSLCRPTRPIPPGMCLADRLPKIPPQITRSDQIFHPGSLCLDALAGVTYRSWLCSCGTRRRGGRVGSPVRVHRPFLSSALSARCRGAGSLLFSIRNTELSPKKFSARARRCRGGRGEGRQGRMLSFPRAGFPFCSFFSSIRNTELSPKKFSARGPEVPGRAGGAAPASLVSPTRNTELSPIFWSGLSGNLFLSY